MKNTTLYVDNDVLEEIRMVSKELNVSSALLIKKILLLMNDKYINCKLNGKLTKYQRHNPYNGFEKFRIDFHEFEIDVFSKLSYCTKVSLSHLLFLGFLLFFNKIVKELKGNVVKNPNSYTDILVFYKKYLLYMLEYIEKNAKRGEKQKPGKVNRT